MSDIHFSTGSKNIFGCQDTTFVFLMSLLEIMFNEKTQELRVLMALSGVITCNFE